MKITVKVGHLQALLLTAGKTDIHFYLNTVHFEVQNGTLFMVTTDSHRLSYMRQPAYGIPDQTRLIRRDGLTTAMKGLKPQDDITLDLDLLNVELPNGATITGVLQTEAGKFPDWRRVVPVSVKINHVHAKHLVINPPYLADLAKAADYLGRAKGLSKAKQGSLRLWAFDENGSLLAAVVGHPDYGAVVMASRVSEKMREQGIGYTALPDTAGGETDPAAEFA